MIVVCDMGPLHYPFSLDATIVTFWYFVSLLQSTRPSH